MQRARETLDEAETICNQLKAVWTLNMDKLGNFFDNVEACRCFTMTFNNLGVLYKQ